MMDCKIMTNKSIMILSLAVLHSMFINGKTTCKWKLVEEWHTQPVSYVVNWTLTENICMDVCGDCWFADVNIKMSTSGNQAVPQICPLQIQLGDILIISSEPSLQSPEINLMNVSEASFLDCLQNTTTEDQLLFGCKLKGMHTINSQWLSVGTHYFITVKASGPSLCHLGLRLNVTVKEQFCQENLSSQFCSGHGRCLTEVWRKTYNCHCEPPFSGKYCQELDVCSYKPCKNNGSCINKREIWNKQGYECICHPPFTGINCSEIIGQCKPHICFHGNCNNITEKSFICECDEPYSGPFCEESIERCVFPSGWKRGICQNKSSAYICECQEGFLDQGCEIDVNKCSSIPCQNSAECIDIPNGTLCICSPIFIGKLSKRLQIPHESFSCKNNTTCVKYEHDCHCSCMPRFTGKNSEKVIDHCRLLSINCLNEGWCFNIIGRFRYICTPGYTRNLCWFLRNDCLIPLYHCCCGSISHNICQAELPHPSQFKSVWELEFTECGGEKCDVAIDAYFFLASNCTENAVHGNRSEDLGCVCLFQCEETMEICTNGFSCLTEEDNKEYFCLCILRRPGKMHLENTTDYQGSGCQHEAIYKDEFNISRCNCSLGYIDRFCILYGKDCLENQSTSVQGLSLVLLHNCNCSCLQSYKRNICETEIEDYKYVPCKNGATSIHLSDYFFCIHVPEFTVITDIEVDEYPSDVCANGSSFVDLRSTFNFLCQNRFQGIKCEIDADECASHPCKNGATCIDQPGNYFCRCVAPFKGPQCEYGPCDASNPCENGAVCREEMDLEMFPHGYQCQCGKGFSGPHCEINVNECSSSPCLNGYCYDMVDSFSCFCSPGYVGLRCEQDIDDCILNACEHNSTCKDLHLSYQCVCLSGWEGSFCEQESNDCKMNPCKNNSTCADLYNSYRCECTSGWTGQNCSEEINECDSDPCMNGALCHESIIPGQFVCLCPPFYTGKICHQHYNPCNPLTDPCKNNSTCLTLVDGDHYCVCREGFEGEHCEINVNECLSLPCQNYGDCEDGVNSFRCVCRSGFSGHLCEIETECSSKPCKINGTCMDLISRFLCNCEPGSHGSLCELNMNECEIPPCLDGENCVNRTSGYHCLCAPGYTGVNCEVNIDECLSKPCLHGGTCTDGINHYTCDCKSGFSGTHCERNANDCLSNPCLHERCTDLINEYQCSCDIEWASSRCEIKINDSISIPCVDKGFCQKSVHGFTCICPSGYTGAYCEINIGSAEPELNLDLCLNEEICAGGPRHIFSCRCLPGFSGQFCEININKCFSSPCLNGANCEDHMTGYICKCQQGWTGHHCEKELDEYISNSCVQGICIENKPSFGSTCLCIPGFVICSTELLCGDEIRRISCLPPISQRTEAISTQTYTVPTYETLVSSFPSARTTRLWTVMYTCSVDQGSRQTDIFKHGVPTTGLSALSIGISFESYLLEELISTRAFSAKDSLTSFTDASSSQFLNFGGHDSAQIVWSKTSVSHMPIQTSVTPGLLFLNGEERTSFIYSSLMTDFIFSTQSVLFENDQTIALSATTMSSVISDIPGADSELNRHSLFSCGFLLTTPSTSAPPIVSRGAQEDTEEYSAVSLISRREHCRLLSSSMSPISPAKIIISKQVAILNSSTLHRSTTQASFPSEYQVITEASSNQRLTNSKSQTTDSLSKLSQTCATCSVTAIKSSHKFSDQVLRSKQSHFYEMFWMNSALLSSWYALMGTQTITSTHSFSSTTEIMPSVPFTELSSLFPSKMSTKRRILPSSLEELNTLSSNLDVNLCLDMSCLSIVPSQTVSLDLMNSDLTSELNADNSLVSENIFKISNVGQYGITMDPIEVLNQDNLLGMHDSKRSHKQFKLHTTDSSLYFELNLRSHPEIIHSRDLKNNLPPYIDLLSDFSEETSNVAFYTASVTQSLPIQTSFPMSVLMPDWTYYTDYLTLTSNLKEKFRTSSEWSKWELQPSVHDWESSVASQRLFITRSLTLSSLESIPAPRQLISDFSCVCYYGDSYLEFQNVFLNTQNNISLEFQTSSSSGLLLYIKQNSNSVDGFFIQLFIENGTLKYHFSCAGEAKLKSINTTFKVDDGQKYALLIKQDLDPCKAELTILGRTIKASESINHLSGKTLPESGSVFIGGFPNLYGANQISEPVENFTGCIKVIEVNDWGLFLPSKAVKKHHIDNCRSQNSTLSTTSLFATPSDGTEGIDFMWTSLNQAPAVPSICQENVCDKGGTCHPVFLSSGIFSFQCDCPLHVTGRFCEQDADLFFPSFNGNSYLELPFFPTLNEPKFILEKEHNRIVTIYLTIKTTALNGTILYSSERTFGQQFLHLFLVEGRPTVKYGCGTSQNSLTLSANYSINTNAFIPITIRYTMPIGSSGVVCMIEMTADGKPPIKKKNTELSHASQVHFESMFLGHIPEDVKIHENAGHIYGFKGCIRQLQVNNKELFIIDEALRGKNIENCHVPQCVHHLCHNNGTCISDSKNWFCECPRLYSGKLCQFATCDTNPCRNGATCVPKSGTDIVCLCPYGRSGHLCTDAINITQPRFSGTDAFGYTSFLAYSRIPDISFSYEFHLKFQLANNHSALQNNLIFYTGQKGYGLNGDDFLAVGLRNGSVVYNYNLGSGVASISSDPLDLSLGIHTVYLGRVFRMGWLKVDDHNNKSIISPGKLVGLNVFSQFYVGGYSEYIPDLLPNGADFKNGFQGCIFTIQVRTKKDGHFRRLGNPEGRPNAGRSVGQCDASPCSLMTCGNGGTCIDSGSTAYCDCPTGWKGAFCSETVSTCDPEHNPPHQCSKGATCISLPHGYTCYCPLGTTGTYCEEALSISDPSFRSHELSWMSFSSFHIRKKTHIQLQFQPLSADGILFYVAQHLKAQSGDFLCISLVNGSVQFRYNLGDKTIILETLQKVTINGSSWHVIKAGRVGADGYLDLDGINVTEKVNNVKMNFLDTNTDFYIGGVSSLNLVNPMAIANEPVGFQGCVRGVIINNHELQLTELGAKGGSNVGDCDGTACGYNVCRNGGDCIVNGTTFTCRCLPHWTGNTCDQSVYCLNNRCLHRSLCIPDQSFSYTCLCTLGWVGRYCEKKISFSTAKFMGNSYIKYIDPNYRIRNLQFTTISLNFSTTEREGLLVWIGKAQNEDDDFLAIGLHNQTLKIAVNLGESISASMIYSNGILCCNKWYHIIIIQNQTLIKAYLDDSLILSEDIDPCKKFVALNYYGISYLGGFEYGRKVNIVTQEIFKRNFVGKIKDVFFQDSNKVELIKSEGYNVYNGDEQN